MGWTGIALALAVAAAVVGLATWWIMRRRRRLEGLELGEVCQKGVCMDDGLKADYPCTNAERTKCCKTADGKQCKVTNVCRKGTCPDEGLKAQGYPCTNAERSKCCKTVEGKQCKPFINAAGLESLSQLLDAAQCQKGVCPDEGLKAQGYPCTNAARSKCCKTADGKQCKPFISAAGLESLSQLLDASQCQKGVCGDEALKAEGYICTNADGSRCCKTADGKQCKDTLQTLAGNLADVAPMI